MNKFLKDESGAALVEYGLLVGLIAVVAMTAIQAIGTNVNALFTKVGNKLGNVANSIS